MEDRNLRDFEATSLDKVSSAHAMQHARGEPVITSGKACKGSSTWPAQQCLVGGAFVVLGVVAWLPPPETYIGLLLVPRKVLVATKTGAVVPNLNGSIFADMLVRVSLNELSHPKPTCVASCSLGWQGVIRTNHFVSVGHVGLDP